jgi:hypothetical protein
MNLIKSKQRIADHGEVFTPPWMVEAMLDLVKHETERVDSRFLEPACGSGNFLVSVLQRKLAAVELKFGKSDFERRHYALLALMCTYGIELLEDNIAECRANMLEIFADYLPGSVPMSTSATYKEIQKWVMQEFGFTPKTCWIAHCKEIYGLPLGRAPNRQGKERAFPCPPENRPAIKKAFQHFGMLA